MAFSDENIREIPDIEPLADADSAGGDPDLKVGMGGKPQRTGRKITPKRGGGSGKSSRTGRRRRP